MLRLFGAKIGHAYIRSSVKIWAPWNLEVGDYAAISDGTDCYCVDKMVIGKNAVISQYAFLCTAGHDISSPNMELTTAPIHIGAGAWVAAGAFVGPGVTVGEGAVCAACAVVVKDVEPWMVVGGNPAKAIKKREIREVQR